MQRSIAATALIISMVTTGLMLAPGTASAGPNKTWIVDSFNGRSQTQFRDLDELLTVCDTKADGLRAVGFASWSEGGYGHAAIVQDVDGANGNCAPWKDLNIGEGVTVKIEACARDGQSGPLQDCRYIWATA